MLTGRKLVNTCEATICPKICTHRGQLVKVYLRSTFSPPCCDLRGILSLSLLRLEEMTAACLVCWSSRLSSHRYANPTRLGQFEGEQGMGKVVTCVQGSDDPDPGRI